MPTAPSHPTDGRARPARIARISGAIAVPLAVLALAACGSKTPPEFDRQAIARVIQEEIYNQCPAVRSARLPDMPYVDVTTVTEDLPPGMVWCRYQWLTYREAGIWWAADEAGVTIESVYQDEQEAQVTLSITLYTLTEPPVRGRPVIDKRRITRRLQFVPDRLLGWRWAAVNRPMNPNHW